MAYLISTSLFMPLLWGGASIQLSQTVSEVIVQFFQNLFYHPSENKIAVLVIVIVVAALVVGSAFLVKLLYDRYRKIHPL